MYDSLEILLAAGIAFIGIFIAEYQYADVKNYKDIPRYIPSRFLREVATILGKCFEAAGRAFAWISSYLAAIDLDKIWRVFQRIFFAVWLVVLSPFEFLWGFVKESRVWKHPWLVPVGSGILVVVAGFAATYTSFGLIAIATVKTFFVSFAAAATQWPWIVLSAVALAALSYTIARLLMEYADGEGRSFPEKKDE